MSDNPNSQPTSEQGSSVDDLSPPRTETLDANNLPDPRLIGPYKLLQKIGEGGMGTVWMAHQEQPVRRRVAVKLIKDAFADKKVVARFEAERQALAMMDHPNIAKVLDVGNIRI